jgi:predicted RNA binding protein YcfA (HicA-like mRNA interferase family)
MAGSLPVLSGAKLLRAVEKPGWSVARRRGSHMVMVKPRHRATLSVPDHAKVAKRTLRSLLRAAGVIAEELLGGKT